MIPSDTQMPVQSDQEYVYDVGFPDHTPGSTVSVWPTVGVPVIDGAVELEGKSPTGADGVPIGPNVDVPVAFEATTATANRSPASIEDARGENVAEPWARGKHDDVDVLEHSYQ